MFVHIPRELREKPFECTMCPKKFHSSALLKEHLRFVHSMEPNFCKFEVKRLTDNLKKLHKNIKTEIDGIKSVRVKKNWKEAAEQIVPCPTCGKFLKQKSLSQHYKQVHEAKKNCVCDFCNRGFYSKHQLATHMFVHMSIEHRVKPFHCDLCHKKFHSLKLLKEHVKYTHLSKLRLWKCKCGKAYNNPGSLRQHKRIIHDNVKKVGAPRQCEQCGKNYSNTTELNEHIKVVHTEGGRGTHMCADCGLTFDYARQFSRHLLTHQEKTVICEHPGCGRKYVNRKILVNHQKQVHIAKTFICSAGACRKAFQTNSMLVRHVAQIHEKRRDDCPVEGCKYTNGRRCYMKVHLKTHTELEPDILNAFIANIKWMNLV